MDAPDPLPNQLAAYAPQLTDADDIWGLRLLLHDFGLVWQHSSPRDRIRLIAHEPPTCGNRRWDAFLAAYAEHLAYHEDIEAPAWVYETTRYLPAFWFPGAELETLRVEAIVHAPAAFEAHGILLARRELEVV